MSTSLARLHDLRKLEDTIEGARQRFYLDAGGALTLIRDDELWKEERGYDDFDHYCQKRWGWSRKRADQLILSVKVVNELPTAVGKHIDNEASARALAKVPEAEREAVVREAVKEGPVTAPAIAKAAAKVSAPAKPVRVLDCTGREVHPTLMELWDRRNELTPLATQVSELKCFFEKKMTEDDPLFAELHHDILIKLKTVHYYITSAKFEYVCGFCQGKCKVLEQHCQNCHGTGLMTKWQWERQVPEELKRFPK